MAPTVEDLLLSLNQWKRGFVSPNETAAQPNYTKSCMARYNEFRSVCSIREYRSFLLKLTRWAWIATGKLEW